MGRAFTVTVTQEPTAPPGIIDPEVADLLGTADRDAVEMARPYLAFAFGSRAFVEDVKAQDWYALSGLFEEIDVKDDALWE